MPIVYQFIGLLRIAEFNAARAADPRCDSTTYAINTVLSAYAALESLALETAFAAHPELYAQRHDFRRPGLNVKYTRLLTAWGRDHEQLHPLIAEVSDARIALTHSEPDHERSRYVGGVINATDAARFAAGVREVALWLWGDHRPAGVTYEFETPNPLLMRPVLPPAAGVFPSDDLGPSSPEREVPSMDVIETVAVKPTARNRWKAAFFVLLALSALAIELAREAANFAGARLPSGPPMSVMATPEYAIVQGSWVRTDGGSVLMPNSVLIQCDAGTMQCNEAQAQVMVSPGFRYLDVISQNYPVTAWTADSITYAKGDAGCVNYTTRIDIAQQRATATRKIRNNPPAGLQCETLEPEIRMELVNGVTAQQAGPQPSTPLIDAIAALLR